jgi:hypothetical protein
MKHALLILFTLTLLFASCIQKEALNAEADILTCIVDNDILKREPIIQNDKIMLLVKGTTDLIHQAPEFTLTPGASIEPLSGTTRDFSVPQQYVVTSEDHKWKKTYNISYITDELSTKFHFDDAILSTNGKYYIFVEKNNDFVTMEWSSGNIGYAMTGVADSPEKFPTFYSANGYMGGCACLVTRTTGAFGELAGMPISAGNLYIGTFNSGLAISNIQKATAFGFPFFNIPVTLTGYYKYKAGDIFYNKTQPVPGKKDQWQIYGVFYETDETLQMLDGTNVFTHPNVISVALSDYAPEANQWTQFSIPFVLRPGKTVDHEKLKNGKYNLTIVLSSSLDGGTYEGALGSTLFVDEVELLIEN